MDKDEREKAILAAATEVFGRLGYTETRMAEIAREAGMSYGLLYHYFRNKESLFDALVERWWHGFHGLMASLNDAPLTTGKKLTAILDFLLSIYIQNPNLIAIYVKEISRGFAYHAHSQGRDRFNQLFFQCSKLMEEGQKRGELRDDIQSKYLSYVFLGAIDAFLSVLVLGEEHLNEKRKAKIISAIMQVFLEGAAKKQDKGG